jgi:N-acetylhexosamine 1-kinase
MRIAEERMSTTIQIPLQDRLVGEEYPTALAARIASRFDLPGPVEAYDFTEKGNINQHTFLITGGPPSARKEFLLQCINQQVFTRPWTVMAAMISCLEAQRRGIAAGLLPADQEWETITLVPTRRGDAFLEFESRRGRTWWRLMAKIGGCRTFKSLGEIPDRQEQLALAEQAARGLAIYGDLTADMDTSRLVSPLPGYRNTRVYFDQLHSILLGNRMLEDAVPLLPDDPIVRQSTEQHYLVHLPPEESQRRVEDPELRHFIEVARGQREFGLTLLRGMEVGKIRTVAIHGDTKLDNFLFCGETGRVKAMVDLDTIMPHTWLADWGDMVRSLVNVAGEKERDRRRIVVDMDIYKALARGFLRTAQKVTTAEVELMADAVEIIALELGIRFMTDYLRGDTYFKLSPTDPPDLNKVRGMAQLTLFERLRENGEAARRCTAEFSSRGSGIGG